MNFWQFLDSTLDRLPGWPSERQIVMVMTYALSVTMIVMAKEDPSLWRVELYKTLVTVVTVTGFVNMILAFYFAANKSDEARSDLDAKRAETSGKLTDLAAAAIASTAAPTTPDVILQPGEIAQAANAAIDQIGNK